VGLLWASFAAAEAAAAADAGEGEGRRVVVSLQVRQVDCDVLSAGDGLDAMKSAIQGAILQKAGCWVDISLRTSQCAKATHGHGTNVMVIARVDVPRGAGSGTFQSLAQSGSDPSLRRVLEARVSHASGVRPLNGSAIRITDLGAKAEGDQSTRVVVASDARKLVVPGPPDAAAAGQQRRGRVLIAVGVAVIFLGLLIGVALGSSMRSDRSHSAVTLVRRSVPEHAPKPERWPILV